MTYFRKNRLAVGVAALLPICALANPSGSTVVAGDVTIGGQGSQMVITQNSNSAIVNWNSFSVGANESVQFQQPSASAAILNRVTGNSASNILGSISSNGRVFLVNARGIVFGQGSEISVGSLIASTLDISDANFTAGKYAFKQGSLPAAGIDNNGTIESQGGSVALIADHVHNAGLIRADAGVIALNAGAALTVSFDRDGLVNYEIDDISSSKGGATSANAGVFNSGELQANSGTVYMTASVARSVIKTVVNNTGSITAATLEDGPNGAIILAAAGGDTSISGDINGSYVAIVSSHDINKNANETLSLYTDGLSATAGNAIDLASDGREGSANSYLNVGSEYAFGVDLSLVQQLQEGYPDLAPTSIAPNAAFQAGNTVTIGHLFVGGSYLFVRAAGLAAEDIGTEGNLFYNYRPVNDNSDIDVVQASLLPFSASSVTLAYGGTGYNGDINVSTGSPASAIAKVASGSTTNYVFMSNGHVHGSDTLETSGVIAVLNGTSQPDGGDGDGGGDQSPSGDQIFAAELAAVTSDTADTIGFGSFDIATDNNVSVTSEDNTTGQCQ